MTIKENVSPAPGETTVKVEPLDSQESQADGGTASPQPPPPPSVIVKAEVKKEEPGQENGKDNEEEEEEDASDKPFSKMTMRLRRNISNPQCVSQQQEVVKHPSRPVVVFPGVDFPGLPCRLPRVRC